MFPRAEITSTSSARPLPSRQTGRTYFTQRVDPREMAWVPPVQAAAVVPLAKKLIRTGFDSLDRVSDSVEASVALVGD